MLTSSSTRGAGTRPLRRGPATFERGRAVRPTGVELVTTRRTYVLDTSVLLSDPGALLRFGDHDVVLPLVVIGELEGKRHHPELGWFARQALRMLDDLRVKHGRLDAPVPVGDDGGTLHVELNHSDPSVLPPGFRNDSNDSRILAVALNLRGRGPRRLPGHQGHAAAGQGRRGRPRHRRVPGHGRRRRGLDRHGRVCPGRRRARRALRRRRGVRARRPPSCPAHRAGAAVLPRLGAGPGDRRTSRCGWSAATARRSGCTAGRPSSGSRSTCCSTRHRHRLARRAGRHRQVGAGAVRRAGVGDGAAGAQEGGRLPAAVRGRRPGARLPARQRGREDVALGAGGLRHPRRAGARQP